MKRNLLKIIVVMLVAVNVCSCLDVDTPKNDNTAYVGDWQLSHILGTEYRTVAVGEGKLDTIVDAAIPQGIGRLNLALDGTGELSYADYKEGEYLDFKAQTSPITYEWFVSGFYTYLSLSLRQDDKDYFAIYSVNRLNADSLVYTSAGQMQDADGKNFTRAFRSTYLKKTAVE